MGHFSQWSNSWNVYASTPSTLFVLRFLFCLPFVSDMWSSHAKTLFSTCPLQLQLSLSWGGTPGSIYLHPPSKSSVSLLVLSRLPPHHSALGGRSLFPTWLCCYSVSVPSFSTSDRAAKSFFPTWLWAGSKCLGCMCEHAWFWMSVLSMYVLLKTHGLKSIWYLTAHGQVPSWLRAGHMT